MKIQAKRYDTKGNHRYYIIHELYDYVKEINILILLDAATQTIVQSRLTQEEYDQIMETVKPATLEINETYN